MRFLCDAMLGSLAKWLRAAGYDAYYAREGTDTSDRHLAEKALSEGRVLLSSDADFLERKPVREGRLRFVRIPQNLPVEEQLALVVRSFSLERRAPRCMECGGDLTEVSAETVAGRIPPGVRREQRRFYACRGCGRVFWYGSHWRRIGGRLERVFG
ncbi:MULTISPECIES: Mut7-C RNAse domain-containing protein [Rubrobacter]|uniref:Mut7-C RNAse domain-containing protein n=1 Tax=Rubrobacter TaxID=42255 RepID=UPI00235DF358|nr:MULTISPECIES: Mut7-C RNAse domain-containing protein [Rubrobacter]